MNDQLTVGSLFSGIGGFDLGLERAGMRTVWFCEQDEFCQRVLARHWPGVPCHSDVRSLVADTEGAPGRRRAVKGSSGNGRSSVHVAEGLVPVPVPYVDVICGGFPCQDLSYAGKGAGIDGARSGLWSEYARIVGELRPRYVIVENVPALLGRGLGRVLGDLAALGYDAEWSCIRASDFGAPHRRDRIWIVAYPSRDVPAGAAQSGAERKRVGTGGQPGGTRAPPDAYGSGSQGRSVPGSEREEVPGVGNDRALADAAHIGHERSGPARDRGTGLADGSSGSGVGDPCCGRHGSPQGEVCTGRHGALDAGWRAVESRVGGGPYGTAAWLDGSWEHGIPRVATGVPHRVDRLRALGNALVPQIAEWIGRRVIAYVQGSSSTQEEAA